MRVKSQFLIFVKYPIPVMNYLEWWFKKKKKNCEKQKATRMAQISFPTLNAHKNRTNCATVHQRNAKKAS